MTRKKNTRWIQLYDSQVYDFDEPSLALVSIETIAHSLSLQCRFSGHCKGFYSVAEHSVLVYQRVVGLGGSRAALRGALMHDAAEAIISDIPSPILWLPECAGLVLQKKKAEAMVKLRWPADYDDPLILQADLELLATEKEQLLHPAPRPWGDLPPALHVTIIGWSPEVAKAMFLKSCRREFGRCLR